MRNTNFRTLLSYLLLGGITQALHAGYVNGTDDHGDGCGTGSGGGDPTHGTAP